MIQPISTARSEWTDGFRSAFLPKPRLPVSDWADLYRWIPRGTSPEWGQWCNDRIPYVREILDCFSDPTIYQVSFIAASQVAKTEILLTVIAYFAHQDPSPMMLVFPTTETAEKISKKRIEPMFTESPRMQGVLKDNGGKKSASTILSKQFSGGGSLSIVGANAPSGLASEPIRVVLRDETDRFPDSAGVEGDPLKLSEQRTANFHNRKIGNFSTPTIHGRSKIEAKYAESDQRRYWVPCPHCGQFQVLRWEQVKLKNEAGEWDPDNAYYECEHCQGRIDDSHKPAMLAKGEWRAEAEFKGHAGFHLSALYSPWAKFSGLAQEFIETRKNRDRKGLKEFINLKLGEPWVESNDQVDGDALVSRSKPYGPLLPSDILLLTAGADIQDDRIEVEVVGWAPGKESYGVEYRVLMGSPAHADVWRQLDQFLQKSHDLSDGRSLTPACACIDSGGHYTSEVYAFCAARERRRIYPIKGRAGEGQAIIINRRPTRNNKANAALFHVGVDEAKDVLFTNLAFPEPGPGYCHFGGKDRGYDPAYFVGLVSEKRVSEIRAGQERHFYKPLSEHIRNEPLDCRVYSMAALEILNPNWEALRRSANTSVRPEKPAPRPPGVYKQQSGFGSLNAALNRSLGE
jgi:phage terminase large subunit GpA-like protein